MTTTTILLLIKNGRINNDDGLVIIMIIISGDFIPILLITQSAVGQEVSKPANSRC